MNIRILKNECQSKRQRVRRLYEYYQELRTRATSPTSAGDFSEVRTKGTGGPEEIYIRTAQARDKWTAAKEDYKNTRRQLYEIITALIEDPTGRDILLYRLCDGLDFREIVKKWPHDHNGKAIPEANEMAIYRQYIANYMKLLKAARS